MPIDFPSSPTVGQVYTFNGVAYVFTAAGVWAISGASAIATIASTPQGRLTLQTGTPVMTTTQSAKTTIYYTPYVGNQVPIYDGTNMVMTTFAELSVATTDTTKSPAAIGVSKVNDWFVWSDAGTIRIGHGPDWTSDTVRSAGTALVMVNGIWLNNASITNGPAAQRGTYVGTTRSNASSQLDWIYGGVSVLGTAGLFNIWNAYNRVNVSTFCGDSTASWTHSSSTWRAANNATAMRVSFVQGLAEDVFDAAYWAAASGGTFHAGIGFDTTTAFSGIAPISTAGFVAPITGTYSATSPIGYHFVQAIESETASIGTWYGTGGFTANIQTGLTFKHRM